MPESFQKPSGIYNLTFEQIRVASICNVQWCIAGPVGLPRVQGPGHLATGRHRAPLLHTLPALPPGATSQLSPVTCNLSPVTVLTSAVQDHEKNGSLVMVGVDGEILINKKKIKNKNIIVL